MEHSLRYLQERDDFVSRCSRLLPWLTASRLTFLAFWADTDTFSEKGAGPPAAMFSRTRLLRLPSLRALGRLDRFKNEPPWIERRIPKRRGSGKRVLYLPNVPLKQIHRFILRAHLHRLTPDRAAFGFEPGRSRREHAAKHCDKYVVIRLDVRRFFPSIEASRLVPVFRECGFHSDFKTVLAHLVTYHRRLPQGAPTSPKLADLVARGLDRKLRRLAKDERWTYSRYADDLAFSCSRTVGSDGIGCMIEAVASVVHEEGFELHPGKTRVMKRHSRQLVAGALVNNSTPTVPRERRRLVRALIHNCRRNGLVDEARRYRQKIKGRYNQPEMVAGRHPGEVKRSDRLWPSDRQAPFVPSRYRDPLMAYPGEDWPWVYDFWHYLSGLVGEIHSLDPALGRGLLQDLRELKLAHVDLEPRLGKGEERVREFWNQVADLVGEINHVASAALGSPRFLPAPALTPDAKRRVVRDDEGMVAFALDVYKHLFDAADDKGEITRLWKQERLQDLRFAVELRHQATHSRDSGNKRHRKGEKIINSGYRRLAGKRRPSGTKDWPELQASLCEGILTDLRDLRDFLARTD